MAYSQNDCGTRGERPMDWRAQSAALLEGMYRAAGGPLLAISASCTSIILLLALLILVARYRRLHRLLAAQAPGLAMRAEGVTAMPALLHPPDAMQTPID